MVEDRHPVSAPRAGRLVGNPVDWMPVTVPAPDTPSAVMPLPERVTPHALRAGREDCPPHLVVPPGLARLQLPPMPTQGRPRPPTALMALAAWSRQLPGTS